MKRRPTRRGPRALDIDTKEAEQVVSALYGIGTRLYPLSPRLRFLVLNAACATFLVDGDDVSSEAPGKGTER